MTHSPFLFAAAVSIIYLIFRFIEMKYILKENKPFKVLFRDALVVYISVIIGNFILNQIQPIKSMIISEPKVFIDKPDF